jgi:hypothetical protein
VNAESFTLNRLEPCTLPRFGVMDSRYKKGTGLGVRLGNNSPQQLYLAQ